MYRVVIDENSVVIAVANDDNQSGDYNGIGTWCDFTFNEFPNVSQEINDYLVSLEVNIIKPLIYKIYRKKVVLRTLEEISNT